MNETIKLTKNVITREEAFAISPNYVAFAEGNYDAWEKIIDQFNAARVRQPAITAHKDGNEYAFVIPPCPKI